MGLQGKNLGLWDYTLFEIGITEISFKLGLWIPNPTKLGFSIHVNWDYRILKLGLQKSALKLGLWIPNPTKLGFSIHVNWDYRISPYLKLGLRDYARFEIGITGLQNPPYGGPTRSSFLEVDHGHWMVV